jgi:hypothetical protein
MRNPDHFPSLVLNTDTGSLNKSLRNSDIWRGYRIHLTFVNINREVQSKNIQVNHNQRRMIPYF